MAAFGDAVDLGAVGRASRTGPFFEARLARGVFRARSGRGTTDLGDLAAETNAKGFKLIARKAAALLSKVQTDRASRSWCGLSS